MIILGIDTSGYVNAVGVSDGARILAEESFPAKTDSLQQIVDNIDTVLKKTGLNLKEVEGIGVGLGPGSWTGIKVGVTVGKILAFSTDKPVCGISTLEALAYAARGQSSLVCSIISAGIGDNVYTAFYRCEKDSVIQQDDYFIGDIKNLAPLIKAPVTLVGSGIKRYFDLLIEENKSLTIKVKTIEALPSGAAIARLAAIRLEQGKSDNPLSLTPLYLKESTANVFLNKYSGGTK
jgi:tRNA threonylcarbamoyladenosine biosynthesis protein TsaB